VRVLQRRPTNRVDMWEDDRYRRIMSTPDGPALVEIRNRGSIEEPDVCVAVLSGVSSTASRKFVTATLRRTLGLDLELASVYRWAEHVQGLRSTALALRGMRPPRFPDLFETFGSVVPFQAAESRCRCVDRRPVRRPFRGQHRV